MMVITLLFMRDTKKNLSNFIKNILMCAPKMKGGLTDLERHEGE